MKSLAGINYNKLPLSKRKPDDVHQWLYALALSWIGKIDKFCEVLQLSAEAESAVIGNSIEPIYLVTQNQDRLAKSVGEKLAAEIIEKRTQWDPGICDDIRLELYILALTWPKDEDTGDFCTQILGLRRGIANRFHWSGASPLELVTRTKESIRELDGIGQTYTEELINARENWTLETVLETENQ